jgi:hypothetical protein
MQRIGTTMAGNVLVEMSEAHLEKLWRACAACAEVVACAACAATVPCGRDPGMPGALSAVTPAEGPAADVPARKTPPERMCEHCGRPISDERGRHNTCSARCQKALRSQSHRAHSGHRPGAVRPSAPAAPAAAGGPRTCEICQKPIRGRSPLSKVCSAKCTAERNRRYAKAHYRSQHPARPAPAAMPPAQVPASAPAAAAPAASKNAKARRLALLKQLGERSAAGGRSEPMDDDALRTVRETADRMSADERL